jgi:hypothetical protein
VNEWYVPSGIDYLCHSIVTILEMSAETPVSVDQFDEGVFESLDIECPCNA